MLHMCGMKDVSGKRSDGICICPNCGAKISCFCDDNADLTSDDNFHEERTSWHLNWQKMFPEENREITVDSGGVRHRADVDIGRIVLEFQHSPISEQAWQERTAFYMNECEKCVFWVYDRTGCDIQQDFYVSSLICKYSNTLFGCDELARREFSRTSRLCGSGYPVFFDYGKFVVMFYDFLNADNASYAQSCMILTRAKFVEFIKALAAYPWSIMQCFDISEHIASSSKWFFDAICDVLHALRRDNIDMDFIQRSFRGHVVRRSRPGGIANITDYVTRIGSSLRFSQWPFDAWQVFDLKKANEVLNWAFERDCVRGESWYNIVPIDTSVMSCEIIRNLRFV